MLRPEHEKGHWAEELLQTSGCCICKITIRLRRRRINLFFSFFINYDFYVCNRNNKQVD